MEDARDSPTAVPGPHREPLARVLYVEDDDLVARSVMRMILRSPFQVQRVASARAALAVLAGPAHGMSVALVDRQLPDGDGLRLAMQLRDDHGLSVAVVSGDDPPLHCGVPWLLKPFRLAALHELLHALSDGSLAPRSGP